MNKADLTNIMKRAWAIFRDTNKAFAICLTKSWELYRLAKKMRNGIARFAFEKKDGTLRKAEGTLKDISQYIKGVGVDTPSTFRYYDTECQAFRSFKVANLICIY